MTSLESLTVTDNRYDAHSNSGFAVVGGWLIATAVALVFYGLGAAVGVSAIDLSNASALTEKNALIAVVWVLVTWAIALHMGGYFAASFAQSNRACCGEKKAVAVWALSIVMTALFGALGLGTVGLTGVAATAKVGASLASHAPEIAQAADSMKDEFKNIPLGYQAGLMQKLSRRPKANETAAAGTPADQDERLKPSVVGVAAAKLAMGSEQDAKSFLEMNTSLSREEIDRAISELSRETEEVKAQLKAAADKAKKYTAFTLWATFLISVVSLFAAMLGGHTAVLHCLSKEREVVTPTARV